MTDLDKLIQAVEAGEPLKSGDFGVALMSKDAFSRKCARAYHGDLNAALALHEALLPGWRKNVSFIEFADGAAVCTIFGPLPEAANKWDFAPKFDAEAANPACAWLLAILRAYRATQGEAG